MKYSLVRRNVVAILDHNGLPHAPEGDGFAVRFSSALLHVGLSAIGTQVIITLRAAVLRNVPTDHRGELLEVLNGLNRETYFGKWALYDEEKLVGLEYDLLGDHLQEPELMTAIATLARLADQQDDLLKRRFGGLRAYEED